jgi:hypothetical protein
LEEPAAISLVNTQARMAKHRREHRVLRPLVAASHLLFPLQGRGRRRQVRAVRQELLELLPLLDHLQVLQQLLRRPKPPVMSFALVQMLGYWALSLDLFFKEML